MKKHFRKGLIIGLVFLMASVIGLTCLACNNPPPKPVVSGDGTMLPVPTDGSTPNDYTANENAYIAATRMLTVGSFETTSVGESSTKLATQKIESHRVVTKDEVYKQSVSYSAFKGTATRYYINGDNYLLQGASKVSGLKDVKWKSTASSSRVRKCNMPN